MERQGGVCGGEETAGGWTAVEACPGVSWTAGRPVPVCVPVWSRAGACVLGKASSILCCCCNPSGHVAQEQASLSYQEMPTESSRFILRLERTTRASTLGNDDHRKAPLNSVMTARCLETAIVFACEACGGSGFATRPALNRPTSRQMLRLGIAPPHLYGGQHRAARLLVDGGAWVCVGTQEAREVRLAHSSRLTGAAGAAPGARHEH